MKNKLILTSIALFMLSFHLQATEDIKNITPQTQVINTPETNPIIIKPQVTDTENATVAGSEYTNTPSTLAGDTPSSSVSSNSASSNTKTTDTSSFNAISKDELNKTENTQDITTTPEDNTNSQATTTSNSEVPNTAKSSTQSQQDNLIDDISKPIIPEEKSFDPHTVALQDRANYVVILTDFGDIFIELYPTISPKSIAQFKQLITNGYYTNSSFYKMIPHYLIQAGDPTETGFGGSDHPIVDEFSTNYKFERGTVALSNTGNPNTSDAQFFITFQDFEWLDGKYNILGKTVLGLDDFENNFKGTYANNGVLDEPIIINNILFLNDFLNKQ